MKKTNQGPGGLAQCGSCGDSDPARRAVAAATYPSTPRSSLVQWVCCLLKTKVGRGGWPGAGAGVQLPVLLCKYKRAPFDNISYQAYVEPPAQSFEVLATKVIFHTPRMTRTPPSSKLY